MNNVQPSAALNSTITGPNGQRASRGVNDICLSVLDQGEQRKDLAARREIKFIVEGGDVRALQGMLAANGRQLVHNQSVSTVRSVYFDDARLSACRANLDGLAQRRKLRLRWYDSELPMREVYLEIKWRDNRVTGKHRLKLSSVTDMGRLSYCDLWRALMNSVSSRFVEVLMACPEPVAIVEYDRQHFVSLDHRLRVTIDYNLTFYDQTGKQRLSTNFPFHKNHFIVLEGKTSIGEERELRAMLYPFTKRAGRCSKYVHACNDLGLMKSS